MPLLQTRLGYGSQEIVETDNFTRIRQDGLYEWEEIRYDRPTNYVNGYAYCGVAEKGTNPDNAVWMCIRMSYDARGKQCREEFRTGLSWTNRSIGW